MRFSQPLFAEVQQARKMYTSAALEYNVSVLFGVNCTYINSLMPNGGNQK